MKRLAFVLGLILALAFSMPAMAAQLTATPSGEVKFTTEWNDEDGFTASGGAKVDLALDLELDDSVSAVVNLTAQGTSDDDVFGSDPFRSSDGLELAISEAYIQTEGGWWAGGPAVTTRVGRLGADFSDWVASTGSHAAQADHNLSGDGLTVTDLDIWPVSLSVGHIWRSADNVAPEDVNQVLVTSASGDVEGVSFDFALARHQGIDANNEALPGDPVMDYAVGASSEVADGITVGGTFASDGVNEATAYRVDASAGLGDISLDFLYRAAGDDFAPTYAKRAESGALTAHDRRNGFKVSAETNLSGIDLSASFDSSSATTAGTARTLIEVSGETSVDNFDLDANVKMDDGDTSYGFGLGTSFEGVSLKYDLAVDANSDMTHVATAETDVAAPALDSVNLAARLRMDADTNYAVRAKWSAPNGIDFEAGYNSLDTIWGTGADARHEGIYVRGGMTVEF